MLIREFRRQRLHVADGTGKTARVAGMHGDLEVGGDMHSVPRSRIDLGESPRAATGCILCRRSGDRPNKASSASMSWRILSICEFCFMQDS